MNPQDLQGMPVVKERKLMDGVKARNLEDLERLEGLKGPLRNSEGKQERKGV